MRVFGSRCEAIVTFGTFVRKFRTASGQTTRAAAEKIGIARGTLQKIETGSNPDTISVGQICKIAEWTGLDPDSVWALIIQDRSTK